MKCALSRPPARLEQEVIMWPASHIRSFALEAKDGVIGSVTDLLCDDREWTVRWFVVDSGSWLPGRKVLLPPNCFAEVDNFRRVIPVSLTREQIEASPGVDTDKPVSRQTEAALYDHYGWSPYWTGGFGYLPVLAHPATAQPPNYTGIQSAPLGPGAVSSTEERVREEMKERSEAGDQHLRSLEYMTGFSIEARDGSIGHVEDFLLDDHSWTIRYVVVDTVNWWPGKKVLIVPSWTKEISWRAQSMSVDLTREQVRNSPEYDPTAQLDRTYEAQLYSHYGHPPYWA
jgi:hypothetical protein